MLKSSIAFAVFLLTGIYTKSLHAQAFSSYHGLETSIGQMHSGKNVRLGYVRGNQKVQFSVGTKIHINNPDKLDSRVFAYQYRFHAYSFIEHFGLYANLQRKIVKGSDIWSLWFRSDIEIGRLGLRGYYYEKAYIPENGSITQESAVIYDTTFSGNPMPLHRRFSLADKNNIHTQISFALIFQSKVSEHVFLNIATGVGTSFVYVPFQIVYDDYNKSNVIIFEDLAWEPFNPYLRLGFNVVFPNRNNKDSGS
jgi:hypothetical protein